MNGPSQKIFIIDAQADFLAKALQSASSRTGVPYQPSTLDGTLQHLQQSCQEGDIVIVSAEALGPPSDMEGLELIRQWWMQAASRDSNAILTPVVLLTYEDVSELLRRSPLCTFILARACKVVRKPFLLDELLHAIHEVAEVKVTSQGIAKYLRSSARLATVASRTEHLMRNLLGPFTLLHGAYKAHAVDQHQYRHVWEVLQPTLTERLAGSQALVELFFLQDIRVPKALTTDPPSLPLGYMPPESPNFVKEAAARSIRNDGKLHVLVIDDEAESGWLDVYKQIFGPTAVVEAITRVEETETRAGRNIYIYTPPARGPRLAQDFPWDQYDLVLLDLRLLTGEPPRWDDRVDDEIKQKGPSAAQQFSGMMILDGMRSKDPAIPVIMMTASKKAYNLDAAKRHGRVWFLSKEESFSDRAYGQDADDRATAHYQLLQEYVQDALAQDRQNLRKLWEGIKSLPKLWEGIKSLPRAKKDKDAGQNCLAGMKRAFVLLSADLDSAFEPLVGERVFAAEAIVCIGVALESFGYETGGKDTGLKEIAEAYRTAPDLVRSGGQQALQKFAQREALGRDEKSKFFAFTLHNIRGTAAHRSGCTCINFQDGLFCLWLALQALGVRVDLLGYPKVSTDRLVKGWIEPTLGNFNGLSLTDPLGMIFECVNANFRNSMHILFKYMQFILLAQKFGLTDPLMNGFIYSRFLINNIRTLQRSALNAVETTFGKIEGRSLPHQEDDTALLSARPQSQERQTGRSYRAKPSWFYMPL